MAKQIVGLKIGASGLTAARVRMNGSAELMQVAREPLPPGVVAGGEVRDAERLSVALKDFFARNRLPRRAVRIGIANNRIGVRTIEVSGLDDPRLLANAVRFRAQEALPIPVDKAVLDFQVLGEGMTHDGRRVQRVLLVVAYRDLVEAYARACRAAGVRLVGVDLDAFALLRSLVAGAEPQPEVDRSALVAVAIGSERSTLAVSDGYTCEFTRVVDWGGASLTAALGRALGLDPAQAEALKTRLSVEGTGAIEGLTEEEAGRAREALRSGLQSFAREVVSSLQYYQGQPGSLGVREVVLAGGTAQLGGVASALQRLMGIPVRIGDPLAAVSFGKRIPTESSPALAIPIGLGMGR